MRTCYCGCANRNNTSAFRPHVIDCCRRRVGNLETLRGDSMFVDAFNSDWLERSVSDMQSDFNKASPAGARAVDDGLRKVKTSRGCGNGDSRARENRLVALAVCCARP